MSKFCSYCMAPISPEGKHCPECGKPFVLTVPAHHLLPGTVLNNKFYVGKALGEGGFGITYIGRDLNLDLKVAIKEFYPNGFVNRSNSVSSEVTNSVTDNRRDFFEKGREKFLNEARTLAKFSGEPGIVDVRDFFQENNTAYIIMEYLDGTDLKNHLKQHGRMAPRDTVSLLMPIMSSLKNVHTKGLIHRDISPDNIMLVNGRVKLLDFGAARNVSADAQKSLSVMLKPGYAPEEQYRSKGNQGPWTDVYALCATMYKCITGITPDDSNDRLVNDEVKTPSQLGIKIEPVIENAIMRGMCVRQQDRFQSMDELIHAFNSPTPVFYNRGPVAPPQPTYANGQYRVAPSRTGSAPITGNHATRQPVTSAPRPTNAPVTAAPRTTSPVTSPRTAPQPPQGYQPVPNYAPPQQKPPRKKKKLRWLKRLITSIALTVIASIVAAVGVEHYDKFSLPKDPLELTFKLDEVTYTLPCDLEEFTSNGWEIADSASSSLDEDILSQEINAGGDITFTLENSGQEIDVLVQNQSAVDKALENCTVVELQCSTNTIVDIEFSKQIGLSSNKDDIIEAFGKPDLNSSEENRITYCESTGTDDDDDTGTIEGAFISFDLDDYDEVETIIIGER